MVFSSLIFLFAFLPVVLCLYYILPGMIAKNALLIIASILFYAYGEPIYILLMLFSTGVNYCLGRLLTSRSDKKKKAVLISAVLVNLGMLGVFKYADMFIDVLNGVTGMNIPLTNIQLPIGISFFTFQALSYVIDVYRNEVKAQKNYFNILLYIALFPQLIAGPIVKYHDIQEQISKRKLDIGNVAVGMRRFIIGLSKKVLISNTMAFAVDGLFDSKWDSMPMWAGWIVAISYMLQIYFDFSGYSDMAIGLGQMFGFKFLENFNYPYKATSIKEFWRRWHISLSTWFKEYLYIPLGGNRKGKLRTGINKVFVFFCTGLWHGASWTFVLWGLWHGFFLLMEEWLPMKKIPKIITRVTTLLIVCIGFVFFRATSLEQGADIVGTMFMGWSNTVTSGHLVINYLNPIFVVAFLFGIIASVPFWHGLREYCMATEKRQKIADVLSYIGTYALLIVNVLSLAGGMYNPFIYFRF